MIRQLITDADILSGRVRSPIVLSEGVVMTPAARDRAAIQGLEVREAHDVPAADPGPCPRCARAGCDGACARGCANCGQPACAGGCSGACASGASSVDSGASPIDGLDDGVYLLRVQDGRAVSIQPAAGPSLMRRSSQL